MNEKTMKHKVKEPEMRAEYNFSGGVRGKYYKRFRNSTAVNKALRSLIRAEERALTKRTTRTRAK